MSTVTPRRFVLRLEIALLSRLGNEVELLMWEPGQLAMRLHGQPAERCCVRAYVESGERSFEDRVRVLVGSVEGDEEVFPFDFTVFPQDLSMMERSELRQFVQWLLDLELDLSDLLDEDFDSSSIFILDSVSGS